MKRKTVWWDRALWWRVYHPGGFDGYRTMGGRRLPCATLETALRRPGLAAEIRQLARKAPR